MAVSKAPLRKIILAKMSILLKMILAEKKSNKFKLFRLYLNTPMPKLKEIIAVVTTNIRTVTGLLDFPVNRLKITAIKVRQPIMNSIKPKITTPKSLRILNSCGALASINFSRAKQNSTNRI